MCKVTVIMAVFNGQNFLGEAIKSILNQSLYDWELICVDDGSTDNSKSIIEEYDDERIRYFYQQNSGSPAKGRNLAISKAKGEFISFIDQDDIYHPESLSKRVEYLENNSNLDMVYSDCLVISENGDHVSDSIINYTQKKPYSGDIFSKLFMGIFIPIQGVMLRKTILDDVGVFDETLVGTDDYHLWLRITYDHEIGFLKDSLASWREHSRSLSKRQITMDESFYYCLDSILKLFPNVYSKIDKKVAKRRVCSFAFDVAYAYFCNKKYRESELWFLNVLKYEFNLKIFTFFLVSKIRK